MLIFSTLKAPLVATPDFDSFCSLESMSGLAEASTTTLRFIEFFSIPRLKGDCVVLLVSHPGANQLARYFPP